MSNKKHKEPAKQHEHEKELEELRSIASDYKDTLQRLQAEFENFSKRTQREKEEFTKIVNASLLEEFLPLADSLAEAIKAAEKKGNAELSDALARIERQFWQILERNGVKRIASVGEKFNHLRHECMMTANEEDKEDDVVLEEFARGYTLNGKVLRPSKVKVNKRDENG